MYSTRAGCLPNRVCLIWGRRRSRGCARCRSGCTSTTWSLRCRGSAIYSGTSLVSSTQGNVTRRRINFFATKRNLITCKCTLRNMTDRQIVQEIMRRLERRQKENEDLKQDLRDLQDNSSVVLLRKENANLKRENNLLKERLHGLMTNYERYVNS